MKFKAKMKIKQNIKHT